ncbi:MAG TPA: tetratricopeptide repeat protein, partial [Pyrinomonadaceae bacterium]|nr:tetratricopeptide repeat protein [Pyrinomonadaceae bacterium]
MRLRPLLLVLLLVSPLAESRVQDDTKRLADEEDALLITVEARQQALSTLLTTAQQSRNVGEDLEAARAWNRAGRLQIQLNLADAAILTYRKALKALAHSPEPATQADSLNGLAKAYSNLGQCDKAEPLLRRSIALTQQHARTAEKAEALLVLSACQDFSDHSLSIQTATESLDLWRSLDNKRGMARAHSALGDYHMAQNSLMDSTQNFQAALELWRELKTPQGEAEALIGLGFLEYRKGAWQASLSFYTQAEQLFDQKAEPYMMGQITAGLAEAFIESGLPETGLDKYRVSLEYYRLAKNTRAEIGVEWGIGRTHYLLSNYLEALSILQATRTKAESMRDPTYTAHCDDFLGRTYYAMNDDAAALNHFRAALQGFTNTNSRMEVARTRALMGQVYEHQGDSSKARADYQTALSAFRKLSDQVNESAALYALGSLELKQGNLDAAEQYLQDSIEVTEKMRRVSTSVDLTAAFSARVHERYEKYVDCLMRKHRDSPSLNLATQAFETSELARARSLTELLRATQTNLFPGLDPQLALQEKQLRQSLQINENARVTLLSGNYKKEQLEVLEQKHRDLETRYQAVTDNIRALNPAYEGVFRPRAWSLRQIQEQVVADEQTVLLEFGLGSEKSYVWAVTRDSLKSFELPSQDSIKEAAIKVYNLLALEPVAETEQKLAEASQELSQLVLSPVAAELNKPKVIIVADGVLNYVPFQILPLPSTNNEILVAAHEIINTPSASILGELQIETSRRQPPPKVL